ncbi:MAG: hypothetical protein LC620_01490, partial [Halobacteriales archaeon]|nr:hypothetical protein [Halobacteriales archaeon]
MHLSSKKTPAISFVALLVASGLVPLLAVIPAADAQTSPCPNSSNTLKVTQVHWNDFDQNGHLDAVRVKTSASVDRSTVYPNDFLLASADNATRRATGIDDPTGDGDTFWLFFPESIVLDAGWTASASSPSFAYSPQDGVVRVRATGAPTVCPTASGFTNTASGRTAFDEAAPQLLAAYPSGGNAQSVGATQVVAVFSEAVNLAGASATWPNDFCFTDAAGNTHPFQTVTGTGPSKSYTLKFFTTGVNAYALTAADVNLAPMAGTDPMPAVGAGPASLEATGDGVTGCAGAGQAFTDPAGNPGIAPSLPFPWTIPESVPVGGPYVTHVHASVGDPRVVVEFNGPVGNSAGSALTGGFSVSSSSPDWLVGSVSHVTSGLGANRVVLNAVSIQPGGPSDPVFTQSSIKGIGGSALAPQAAWTLSDDSFLSGPRIVRMTSYDADSNGCVEGARVTFNEPIPSVFGPDWSLFWTSTGLTDGPITPVAGPDARTIDLESVLPNHNVPGNANCHGTGPTDLPRVSAADSPTLTDVLGNNLAFAVNPPATAAMHRTPVRDGAAPIVVLAKPRDCGTGSATTCTPNGKLDGYLVPFAEP